MKVKEIMTPGLEYVQADDTIKKAADGMKDIGAGIYCSEEHGKVRSSTPVALSSVEGSGDSQSVYNTNMPEIEKYFSQFNTCYLICISVLLIQN